MSTITNAPTYPVQRPPWIGAAGVASNAPTPEYANVFIPILWSSKLIEKFYDASIVPAMSNTDYEGEIKNSGDHVMIRRRPDITIKQYKADGDLEIDRPSAPLVELLIDQGNYWNLALDDVMEVQSDLDMMNMWAQDAAEQMRITVDAECLDYAYSDLLVQEAALTGNLKPYTTGKTAGRLSKNINLGVTGTPVKLSPTGTGPSAPAAVTQDIMDFILRIAQVMDENNLPETGRFIVLPSWACQMLKASDLRMANEMGDGTSVYRNGQIGTLDRMAVYKSNLLPMGARVVGTTVLPGGATTKLTLVAGESVIYGGIDNGLTFASQITKVETLRSEKSFSNLMRGLQVYGRKVVDSKSLIGAVVQPK